MTNCRIEIKGLASGTHEFEFRLDGSFFESYENDTIADADLDVRAIVEKGSGRVSLEVLIRGSVTVLCDRCLSDLIIPVDIDAPFSVLFSEYADDEEEGEDVIVLDRSAGEIELSQILYDYVCLSLPIKKIHPDGECDPVMMEKMKDILK